MIVVNTNGSFMLVDSTTGSTAQYNRPSVVAKSPFFQERIAAGQVEIVAELPDGANDADFAKILADMNGDIEATIAAYKSELLKEDPDEEAAKLAAAKAKAEEEAAAKAKAEEEAAAKAKAEEEAKANANQGGRRR